MFLQKFKFCRDLQHAIAEELDVDDDHVTVLNVSHSNAAHKIPAQICDVSTYSFA